MASSEVAHGARRRKGRKLDAVLFLTASGLVGGKAGVLGRALRPAGCQGCRPTYAGQLPTHPSDPIPQIPSQLGWGGIGWADTDGGGMEPWYGGIRQRIAINPQTIHPRSAYAIPYAIRSIQSAIRSTYPHTDQGGGGMGGMDWDGWGGQSIPICPRVWGRNGIGGGDTRSGRKGDGCRGGSGS